MKNIHPPVKNIPQSHTVSAMRTKKAGKGIVTLAGLLCEMSAC